MLFFSHTVTVAALPYDGGGEQQQNPDDIIILHLGRPRQTKCSTDGGVFFCCFLANLFQPPQQAVRQREHTHERTHALTHARLGIIREHPFHLLRDPPSDRWSVLCCHSRTRHDDDPSNSSVRRGNHDRPTRSKEPQKRRQRGLAGSAAKKKAKTLTTAGAATRHRIRPTPTHTDSRRDTPPTGLHCSARPGPVFDDLAK